MAPTQEETIIQKYSHIDCWNTKQLSTKSLPTIQKVTQFKTDPNQNVTLAQKLLYGIIVTRILNYLLIVVIIMPIVMPSCLSVTKHPICTFDENITNAKLVFIYVKYMFLCN